MMNLDRLSFISYQPSVILIRWGWQAVAVLVLVVGALTPHQAHATTGVNQFLTFQGKVVNSDGTNVTDGLYDFEFKLYNADTSSPTTLFTETWSNAALFSSTMSSAPSSGGESLTYSSNTNEATLKAGQILWNTTKLEPVTIIAVNTSTNVITISPTRQAWSTSDTITNQIYVKDGIFKVALNSLNQDWNTVDFADDSLFLGINFNADGEMKPRIRLTSTAYAFYAENAHLLQGVAADSFLRSDISDNFTSGTLTFDASTELNLAASSTLDIDGDLEIADPTILLNAPSAQTILATGGDLQFGADNDSTNLLLLSSDGTNLTLGTTDGAGLTIDTAGSLTIADATAFTNRVDLAAHGNNVGLNLPTNAGAPSGVTGTAEGDIVWDSTGDALYIHNGSNFIQISGSGVGYTDWSISDGVTAQTIGSGDTLTVADSSTVNATVTATDTLTYSVVDDSLNFAQFADSMSLDAATTIALGANAFNINLDNTGDFVIQDNGTPFATFTDAGVFTLDSLNFDGTTIGLTTDTDLLSLASGALTVNGSVTTTSTITLPNSSVLTGDTSYLRSSRGLAFGANQTYYVNSSGTGNLNALTLAGTLTANGAFTLGDNGDLGSINTSDWDIGTTGVLTGISGITTDGGYTQSGSGANTFSGTTTFSGAIDSNGDVSFADTDIAFDGATTTFTTTGAFTLTPGGAVVLGDGGDTMAINTSDWDISTTGDLTGIGSITMDGRLDLAAHGNNVGLNIPTNAGAPSGVTGTTEGDIVWDSSNDALYVYDGSGFTQVGGGGYSGWTLSGDTGTPELIASGNTVSIVGGTNGIDTIVSATDTLTLNLDTTEIGTTTFGSGSPFSWTMDTGTDDPVLAFGDGSLGITTPMTTLSGDLTISGGELFLTGISSSSSTTEGTIYYDTDDDNLYVYAGGGWVDLTQQDTDTDTTYTAGNGLTLDGTTFELGGALTEATTITAGANAFTIDLNSTGDFVIADNSVAYATFTDTGVFTLDSLNFDGTTIGLTTDTDLLSLADNALTVNGAGTFTGTLTANGSLVANGAFTLGDNGDLGSINTSDWDISTTGDMTGIGNLTTDGRIETAAHGNNVGLNLPTNAGTPSGVTGTAEGDIVWDSSNDALYVYNGSGFAQIGGGAYSGWTITDGTTPQTISSGDTLTVADSSTINAVVSATDTLTYSVVDDSLNFAQLADSLSLDAATTIALGANAFTINLDSTGDFAIQDAGGAFATFTDAGVFTLDSLNFDGTTIGLTTDTDLLSLASGALTVNGSITGTSTLTLPNSSVLTGDTTYLRSSRGLAFGANQTYYINSSGTGNLNALTLAGTLTANGAFTLGDNGDLGSINTSDWDISTTGALTGISGITTDGGYTQSGSGANTFSGTSSFTAVNAAGGSANSLTLSGTLGAFNGSDTFTGLYLNYTNANHTGSSNNFYGINIAGITGDNEATETAISIGSGWDTGVAVGSGGIELTNSVPSATNNKLYNSSGNLYWNGSPVGGSSAWTDAGNYVYPTSGEVLGNSASGVGNKIAGMYLADSAPLTFGTDNDISFSFSGSVLGVTTGNNDINFDSNTLFIDGSDNRVGIGTTTPSSLLHLLGTSEQLRLGYDASNYTSFAVDSNGNLTIADSGTNVATFGAAQASFSVPTAFNAGGDASFGHDLVLTNQTASKIESYGPLTIQSGEVFENNNLTLRTYGTGNIVAELGASGALLPGTDDVHDLGSASFRWDDVYATNGTIQTSDVRLKENIMPLTYDLNTLMQLRPVTYTWKSRPDRGTKIGLIAQEVQELIPEVIAVGESPEDPIGIRYTELIPLLITSIQQQQNQLQNHHEQLTAFEFNSDGNLNIKAPINTNSIELNDPHISVNGSHRFNLKTYISELAKKIFQEQQLLSPISPQTQQQLTELSDQSTNSAIEISQLEHQFRQIFTPTDSGYQAELTSLSADTASISGNLTAAEATISGVLYADDIRSRRLDELESRLAGLETSQSIPLDKADTLNQSALSSRTILAECEEPDSCGASLSDSVVDASTSAMITDALEADTLPTPTNDVSLAGLAELDALFVNEFLSVTGDTVLTQAQITSNLQIGTTQQHLALAATSIGTSCVEQSQDCMTLYLQPSGGRLNLLAGLMVLDEAGTVTINGDLIVNGRITSSQLALGQQEATPSVLGTSDTNDLEITLATGSALLVRGFTEETDEASDSAHPSSLISDLASISASGSAQFTDIATNHLTIKAAETNQVSDTVIETSATAGTAIIPSGAKQMTLRNPRLTSTTLLYVTPLGSTNNQVLYVKGQDGCDSGNQCEPHAIIGFDQAATQDVRFNWWMVAVE